VRLTTVDVDLREMIMTGKIFKSGDIVPASGMYEAFHPTPHAISEREIYFEGSRFPHCSLCAAGTHYRLASPCIPVRLASLVPC
jgi:hypothetical protein